MSLSAVDTLVKEAEQLSTDEQLLLLSRLIETLQQQRAAVTRTKWQDIRGMAQSSLTGVDAQSWVSETRLESDSAREHQWRYTQ